MPFQQPNFPVSVASQVGVRRPKGCSAAGVSELASLARPRRRGPIDSASAQRFSAHVMDADAEPTSPPSARPTVVCFPWTVIEARITPTCMELRHYNPNDSAWSDDVATYYARTSGVSVNPSSPQRLWPTTAS
jgi:hypothetical protein